MREISSNVWIDDNGMLRADLSIEETQADDFLQLVYDVAGVLHEEMVKRGMGYMETCDELEVIATRTLDSEA